MDRIDNRLIRGSFDKTGPNLEILNPFFGIHRAIVVMDTISIALFVI